MYSTQSSEVRRCFEGQYRAAKIYDQIVTWNCDESDTQNTNDFHLSTILVYCTCKYFEKATCVNGLCCSHVIGQLTRTIYLTSENWLNNNLHCHCNLQRILSMNIIFLFTFLTSKKRQCFYLFPWDETFTYIILSRRIAMSKTLYYGTRPVLVIHLAEH